MFALFLIANSFRVAMTKAARKKTVNISLSTHLRVFAEAMLETRSQPVARHKSICQPPLGFDENVFRDIDTLRVRTFCEILIRVKAVFILQWCSTVLVMG